MQDSILSCSASQEQSSRFELWNECTTTKCLTSLATMKHESCGCKPAVAGEKIVYEGVLKYGERKAVDPKCA